ncbi:putative RNA polymerase B subunit RPB8 [Trypanosoma cruzi]|uniref:DNA-directed RNA polymerases I, II, and III subunit RPABC3 n=2 Tax=Trypanosoma cruzi TaxID=5693 RepID=Q4DCA7_TRYCC|nr:RNA polymerase B subunit RPB8, putative [Trypanosoma cruzi]PBJ72175.1 RNA polymerase B subunit RPB8 [Trypanosoma cruzi cruzi]EAN90163.1 RNA polymerase B subunit RPB8, putative [Trypanosoma cruzi]KAF8283064.1 putative RNA polymerase B subunit RPB8 [Trypanosoma cruzi]PWV00633.1 putative RNA polymerase B subunit RPB8 [Trypanosoma cruzi]PWV05896.1 putative RNA polymerase B subunit RPB8 [Trypanosoma cruzi]|eukprot:XP_812014.1 RNA polymerase B subunit RPB8 [Trypanosoma cruzi strain CL Brener]
MVAVPVILEDTFTVTALNPDGVVYIKVSRIQCKNERGNITITSDINTEEFPVSLDDRLTIMLANSIELSGQSGAKHYDQSVYHRETRLQDCDYAMHGRVYGHEVDESSLDVKVHISCGGLLTQVIGTPQSLRDIHYNSDVYILIKRVGK